MAALACNVVSLVQDAKCLFCYTDRELLAAEVRLREQIAIKAKGGTVRTPEQILAASVGWEQLPQHQRDAIEVRQLCQDAVDVAARTTCDATTLKDELKCYCALSEGELRAAIAYLKCFRR